jgi:hypothetical protein
MSLLIGLNAIGNGDVPTAMVSTTCFSFGSITEMLFDLALVTYTLPLFESKTASNGAKPTGIVPVTVLVEPSIIATSFEPKLTTYSLLCVESIAIPWALEPTGIVAITESALAVSVENIVRTRVSESESNVIKMPHSLVSTIKLPGYGIYSLYNKNPYCLYIFYIEQSKF